MTPLKAARRALGRTESSLTIQSILLTGARMIGVAAAFAIPLVLVRVFSQTEFGLYKQVFLIVSTSGQVLALGLPASIFYFVPRDRHDGHRYLVQALSLMTLASGLGAVAILLGGPLLARMLDASGIVHVLPALALLVFLHVPATMAYQPPIADRRAFLGGSVMAGSDLLRAGAIIGFALLFGSVIAVVLAAALVAAMRIAFLLFYMAVRRAKQSPRPSWSSARTQLAYASGMWVAVLFQVGLRHGHTYFVMASVPTAAFAVYSLGIFQLPIVGHLVASVADVMIVRASKAYRTDDLKTLRGVWRRATVRLAALLIPIWAIGECFAGDLFLLLFGSTYLPAVPVFRIFLFFFLLQTILDHGILRATGDTAFLARATAAGLVAMVVALPLLTRWDVMLGAVTSFVLGTAVTRFAGLVKVCRRIDLTILQALEWRDLLRIAALAVLSGLASFAATRWLGSAAARLAVGGALFSLAYGGSMYLVGPISRAEILRLGSWITRRGTL